MGDSSSEEFDGFDGGPNEEEESQVDNETDEGEENEKRASIWKHFTVFVDASGVKFAKCKHTPCES